MSLVKDILERTNSLPAVPGVVQQIIVLVQDPDFSIKQLMETVRVDPGITAHVLRMANSSYFGVRSEITSLEQALAYLGTNHLMEIILSSEMVRFFKNDQKGYVLARGELWQHSMAAALLAQRLGAMVKFDQPATLFTAALLHDVGKLIMSEFVGQEFERIINMVQEEGKSFVDAEREVLGVDHALLGGMVAKNWNFPESIATAIAFHHSAERSKKHKKLTSLVALANLMCISLGVGGGAAGLAAPVPPGLLEEVGIPSKQLDLLFLDLKDILDEASALLDLAQ